MKYIRSSVVAVTSLTFLFGLPASLAAPAAPTLEEVVVTAQRREQSLQDIGLTITAATGDQLKVRKIDSIIDLPRLVPGLTVQKAGFNSVSFTLRGVGFFNSDLTTPSAVTVYVDEAPLPYPAMTLLSAYDLERVEVLKGPQGTLYGQNATGGAINYVTAKPTEEFDAGVTLSYGRFNQRTFDGFVSGPLTSNLTGRVAFRTNHADEWQESTTRPGDELGAVEEYQGRVSLNYSPTETFTSALSLSMELDKSDTLATQYIGYIPQVPGAEAPNLADYPIVEDPRAADWTPLSVWRDRAQAWSTDKYGPPTGGYESDNQNVLAVWRNDLELSDGFILTSITSYGEFETDYVQDFDGTSNLNFNIENYGSTVESFTQEFRLTGETDRLNWIVGANYHHDETEDVPIQTYIDNSSAHAFESNFGIVAEGGINYGNYDVDSYGIFAHAEYELTNSLSAQVGIRYNQEERNYSGCAQDIGGGGTAEILTTAQMFGNDGSPPVVIGINDCYVLDPENNFEPVDNIEETLDEDNFPWKLGLSWSATDSALIYGYVSKGFKAGTVPVVGASTTDQYTPVTQESVLAYEVGAKTGFWDNRVNMNVAAFYYDYEDKQLRGRILDPIFGPLEALVAIPTSRVYGIESQFLASPMDGLTLDVAFTYVDTEVEDYMGYDSLGTLTDLSGTPFPFSPEWHVTSNVDYEFPLTDTYTGFVGASLTYEDDTSAGIGAPDILAIDSYTLLDLRAGVETSDGRYRLMLWGKNVTDEYYWGNAMLTYDTIVRFPYKPATYGVDFSIRF